MTFLDRLNSPEFDFTQNLSGGKIIKCQQSKASTSHFESFWSIVLCVPVENSVIYDDTSRSVLTDAFSDNFGDATKDVFNERGSDMSVDFDTIKPFKVLYYKSLNLVHI